MEKKTSDYTVYLPPGHNYSVSETAEGTINSEPLRTDGNDGYINSSACLVNSLSFSVRYFPSLGTDI